MLVSTRAHGGAPITSNIDYTRKVLLLVLLADSIDVSSLVDSMHLQTLARDIQKGGFFLLGRMNGWLHKSVVYMVSV